jgi:hypothetical protein
MNHPQSEMDRPQSEQQNTSEFMRNFFAGVYPLFLRRGAAVDFSAAF